MSRPVSSATVYPFIPGTVRDSISDGIYDAVLLVADTPDGTSDLSSYSVPAYPFVCVHALTASGAMTIRAYSPEAGNPGIYQYRDFIFNIPQTSGGYGSVQSEDKSSFLFLSYAVFQSSDVQPGPDVYILEPCCARWVASSVETVTLVNEQRLSEPADRINLLNRPVKTFNKSEPPSLKDGYNVELGFSNNNLEIQGRQGGGAGRAPHNVWEDVPYIDPSSITVLKTINGEGPGDGGAFAINISDSFSINADGNVITVSYTE